MSAPSARDIVTYWLGDSVAGPEAADAQRELWYRGGREVDRHIEARFGEAVVRAREGELDAWVATAEGALALVILLDQFTRNIYRGSLEVYSGDALAFAIADRAVSTAIDLELPVTGRIFLYHPFHHSETLAQQNRGVALLESLEAEAASEWQAYVRRSVEGFGSHRDIVARFGRFPHRNRVLGRASTPEEEAYLDAGAETFGQG